MRIPTAYNNEIKMKPQRSMPSLILLFLVFTLVSYTSVLNASYEVEIRVKGTVWLPFSGSYGDVSSQITVDGTTPTTYTIIDPEGDIVSVIFQKEVMTGTLTVELVKDGETVDSKTTTEDYGVVSISHNLKEGPNIPSFPWELIPLSVVLSVIAIIVGRYYMSRRKKIRGFRM